MDMDKTSFFKHCAGTKRESGHGAENENEMLVPLAQLIMLLERASQESARLKGNPPASLNLRVKLMQEILAEEANQCESRKGQKENF